MGGFGGHSKMQSAIGSNSKSNAKESGDRDATCGSAHSHSHSSSKDSLLASTLADIGKTLKSIDVHMTDLHQKVLGHDVRLTSHDEVIDVYETRLKLLEKRVLYGEATSIRRALPTGDRAPKPTQRGPGQVGRLGNEERALLLNVALAHVKPYTFRGALGT